MKEDILKIDTAHNLFESPFTTLDHSQISPGSNLDNQEYYDDYSSFIVEWQKPIPIKKNVKQGYNTK